MKIKVIKMMILKFEKLFPYNILIFYIFNDNVILLYKLFYINMKYLNDIFILSLILWII